MRATMTVNLSNGISTCDWLPTRLWDRTIPGQTILHHSKIPARDPLLTIKILARSTTYETFSLRFSNGSRAVEVVECIDAGRYALVVDGQITLSDLTIEDVAMTALTALTA